MSGKTISTERLEEIARVNADTKKVIQFDKGAGYWSWVNRADKDNPADWHNGFETWLEAAEDAAEPYMDCDTPEGMAQAERDHRATR